MNDKHDTLLLMCSEGKVRGNQVKDRRSKDEDNGDGAKIINTEDDTVNIKKRR